MVCTLCQPGLIGTKTKFSTQLADVTVLIVNAEEVREKELFRAVTTLDQIGVEVISVVLNRAKLKRGKYYKSNLKKYYQFIGANTEGKN